MKTLFLSAVAFLVPASVSNADDLCMLWQTDLLCYQIQEQQGCGDVTGDPFNGFECENPDFYKYGPDASTMYDEIVWDIPQPGDDPGPDDVVTWKWEFDQDWVEHECFSMGDCVAQEDPIWRMNNPYEDATIDEMICSEQLQYTHTLLNDTRSYSTEDYPITGCDLDTEYYWQPEE